MRNVLINKMTTEVDALRNTLTAKGFTEDDLLMVSRYWTYADILQAVEDGMHLTDAQTDVLANSATPVANIYDTYINTDTAYMDDIRNAVEDCANDMLPTNAQHSRWDD